MQPQRRQSRASLAVLLLVSLTTALTGPRLARADSVNADPWFGRDKLTHFAASGSLAVVGYAGASMLTEIGQCASARAPRWPWAPVWPRSCGISADTETLPGAISAGISSGRPQALAPEGDEIEGGRDEGPRPEHVEVENEQNARFVGTR